MIKSLRKRHRQVWIAWAVIMPALILFAWLAIPNETPVRLLTEKQPGALPLVVKSKDFDSYSVAIRTNKERTEWQLEWSNRKALIVPSAVIYQKNKQANVLVGRIEARGDYIFPLSADSTGAPGLQFILYDFIHEQTIDSINLQP